MIANEGVHPLPLGDLHPRVRGTLPQRLQQGHRIERTVLGSQKRPEGLPRNTGRPLLQVLQIEPFGHQPLLALPGDRSSDPVDLGLCERDVKTAAGPEMRVDAGLFSELRNHLPVQIPAPYAESQHRIVRLGVVERSQHPGRRQGRGARPSAVVQDFDGSAA